MRTLSTRELNRALLARQGLLEPLAADLPEALHRIGGLQAQYAPSMYIGLWSRLRAFERDALTRALQERSVVQGTLMRVTIHLVARDDYWPFALAVRYARRLMWGRSRKDVPDAAMARAARTVRRALEERGELRRTDVEALVGKPRAAGIHCWADLVRAPPGGTWERRRADLYAAAEDWLGPPPADDVGDAQRRLVRAYLAGFGPASRKDVASYTGLSLTTLKPVLADLELERFASESGEELLDLPGAPLPDPDTPAGVRFLPTWDATLLVHARRTGILPERFRPRLFNVRMPQSLPCFLLDGAVAGSWRHEDGEIRLDPFTELPSAVLDEVRAAAVPLAAFHG